jgi:tetratricopeptide (TPR) repeat protein
VLLLACTAWADESPKNLAHLVHALGVPTLAKRRQARRELRAQGLAAYRVLRSWKPDGNAEREMNVRILLFQMEPECGPWHAAMEAGRFYFARGQYSHALPLFLRAGEKHVPLRTDKWFHHLTRTCFEGISAQEKRGGSWTDWSFFATGQYRRLVRDFPTSPLRERSLFKLGRHAELLKAYPRGALASFARYSLVSGHPYHEPPIYLEVKNPQKEIAAWPRFLADNPGHPGLDDAAYRLGRAYEMTQDHVRAVRYLQMSAILPDGEYTRKGIQRVRYVIDALCTHEELRELALSDSRDEIRAWARLTMGVAFLREDRFEEALAAFEGFLRFHPANRFAGAVKARVDALSKTLIPLCREARDTANGDRALYDLGRFFYHDILALYNPLWDGQRAAYLGFEVNALGRSHAFHHPDYFERHNNYLAAARHFRALLDRFPDSPLKEQALYSLGSCLLKAPALNHFAVFSCLRSKMLDRARAYYARLVRECPESPLRPDALNMMSVIDSLPSDWMRY